jgi:hypothetical protein
MNPFPKKLENKSFLSITLYFCLAYFSTSKVQLAGFLTFKWLNIIINKSALVKLFNKNFSQKRFYFGVLLLKPRHKKSP